MKKWKEINRVMCHEPFVRERGGEGLEGRCWLLDTALLLVPLPREGQVLDKAQSC